MDQTRGAGVPVKTLFKLLAFLGVTQAEVGRILGMPKPIVNLWARGQRPLPRKHLEAFESFVWGHVAQANEAYLDAMARELGEDGRQAYLHASDEYAYVFPEPPPDSPSVVHRWWTFHVRAC